MHSSSGLNDSFGASNPGVYDRLSCMMHDDGHTRPNNKQANEPRTSRQPY